MTLEDYPVRPEMRIVERHELPKFDLILWEQPDITVDQPYLVTLKSDDEEFAVCKLRIKASTLVEARGSMNHLLNDYLNLPGKREIRDQINELRQALGGQA